MSHAQHNVNTKEDYHVPLEQHERCYTYIEYIDKGHHRSYAPLLLPLLNHGTQAINTPIN